MSNIHLFLCVGKFFRLLLKELLIMVGASDEKHLAKKRI